MNPDAACLAVVCPNTIWWELIKGIPTALATLTIGGVAAYIAYRQYLVAHAKFRLDLFEKRYAVYQATVRIVSLIAANHVASHYGRNDVTQFRQETSAATFLFDDEVASFIEEVARKAELSTNGNPVNVIWADKELAKIADRFRPYMTMGDWR